MKIIKTWGKNPVNLVKQINKNKGNCFHIIDNLNQYSKKVIFGAKLKYKKFIILETSYNSELPIFEGIDKIGFIN